MEWHHGIMSRDGQQCHEAGQGPATCHTAQPPIPLALRIIHGVVMSDQLPTATRVSDPGIRALYRLENRWQAWLDVEVALARSQAELGIIPHDAA